MVLYYLQQKPVSKRSTKRYSIKRAAVGGSAVVGAIRNGLARAARNQGRVGADGDLARYQEGAYVGMRKRVGDSFANLGGTAEVSFCPEHGMEAFLLQKGARNACRKDDSASMAGNMCPKP